MKVLNKREIQHKATLDAIRLAVDTLVKKVGYDAMRIQDICEAVGVSAGTFYHYFPSKSDLLIDRYFRTNEYIRGLYSEKLSAMDEIEALKELVRKCSDYTKSREQNILVPYHLASIVNSQKWIEIEESEFKNTAMLLIEKGQKRGRISTEHSKEDLFSFLDVFFKGDVVKQCLTPRAAKDYDAVLEMVLLWIDRIKT